MNFQSVKDKETRAIVYCRSEAKDNSELKLQETNIMSFTQAQGYTITETFIESGLMDALTYHSLRLRAKYREFDILLVTELDVLGNNVIEITQEITYLNDNGVKVISLKDGELTVETLPIKFRKGFRLVNKNK